MQGFIGLYGLGQWWNEQLSREERETIEAHYAPVGLPSSLSLTEGEIQSYGQSKLAFLSGLATWFKRPDTFSIAKKIIDFAATCVSEADNIIDVHYYYQNRIEIFYRNRDSDPQALNLAVEACEAQISIATKAAAALTKFYQDQTNPARNLERLIQLDRDLIAQVPELRDSYEPRIKANEEALAELQKSPPQVKSAALPLHVGYKQLCIIKEKQGRYQESIRLSIQAREEGWSGDWDTRIEKLKKKMERKSAV